MPIIYANPARRTRYVGVAVPRKLYGAAKAARAKKRKRMQAAAYRQLARDTAPERRRNVNVTVKSTRGVRKLPARPHGVPRPRPGSKPPGLPNPRRRKRRSHTSKDWGAYGTSSAPTRRRKKMARRRRRRKLYGAAAAAVARKRGRRRSTRRRRRHNPAMNPAPRRRRRRKARKSSGRRRLRTRRRRSVSAAAFRTYRRGHGRRRRRRVVAALAPRRRRRRRTRVARSRHWGSALRAYGARRRNPARRRRYGRRRRRNPRPSTQRSLLRARRAIRNRYKTALGRATMRRYRMRSNPGMGTVKAFLGQVLPVAVSLYGARALSYKLAGRIPGVDRLPSQYQGTVVAGVVVAIAHVATKRVAPLQKWRWGIMLGTGLNLVDNVLSAFAPASVKAMFGLGDIYDNGLSEYVGVGEYMSVGATPIDDDLTLSDYVQIDGIEEELGVEEDLGLEEELGDSLSRAYLGGVSRDSLLKQIPSRNMLAPVPARSFTKEVRHAGPGYDEGDVLYTGIFGGGF